MSWAWVGPVATVVTSGVGVAAILWTARKARQATAVDRAAVLQSEARRLALAERRQLYAKFLYAMHAVRFAPTKEEAYEAVSQLFALEAELQLAAPPETAEHVGWIMQELSCADFHPPIGLVTPDKLIKEMIKLIRNDLGHEPLPTWVL